MYTLLGVPPFYQAMYQPFPEKIDTVQIIYLRR